MTQIAVLTGDDRLVETLRSSSLKASRITADELAAYVRASQAPQVLVVDVRKDGQLPASLPAVRRQHPGIGVVLVVCTLDPQLMLEAMRAGVSECVPDPVTPKALDDAVRRVLTNSASEAPGQVYAFIGAKGGVGTTTLAVNTASVLGRLSSGGYALLIDFYIGQGDAAVFLGVEPRFSVVDALDNIHKVDESFFAGLVEKTEAGVHLLAAPTRPRQGALDVRRLRTLLDSASQTYRTTVLDVPRFDMTMVDSLDRANAIVVVTTQEIASLRNAARTAETLRQRYGAARVKVVVNRYQRESAIAQQDIERVVGGSVAHLVPADDQVAVDALNAGRPVVLDKDSRLATAFSRFARDLAGIVKPRDERPAGVLGRLAWRRA